MQSAGAHRGTVLRDSFETNLSGNGPKFEWPNIRRRPSSSSGSESAIGTYAMFESIIPLICKSDAQCRWLSSCGFRQSILNWYVKTGGNLDYFNLAAIGWTLNASFTGRRNLNSFAKQIICKSWDHYWPFSLSTRMRQWNEIPIIEICSDAHITLITFN